MGLETIANRSRRSRHPGNCYRSGRGCETAEMVKCPYQMPSIPPGSSDRYLIAVKCHALRGSVPEKDHHGGPAGHRRFRSEDIAVRFWCAPHKAQPCVGTGERKFLQPHVMVTKRKYSNSTPLKHVLTSTKQHLLLRTFEPAAQAARCWSCGETSPASHARVHHSNMRYTRFAVSWG